MIESTSSTVPVQGTPNARVPRGTLLCEVAWEVCHQLGGIYTVVSSKVRRMVECWGANACLIGPYLGEEASAVEFEETPPAGPFGDAAADMLAAGYEVHFGRWLVSGHPTVVLLAPDCVRDRLDSIKFDAWSRTRIDLLNTTPLVDQVLCFGHLVHAYITALAARTGTQHPIVAHFHEWMGATALPQVRHCGLPVATVFTTHATQVGRFLAMDAPHDYLERIPQVDPRAEARRFRIHVEDGFERAAAAAAHVFTTVSNVTGFECEHLLGRKPDAILPNGRNVERFLALHEFQNLHRQYKEKIHQFVIGHFFPSYTFDLERTLYVFTSGRYEYTNKGFDLTIAAMGRLNDMLKASGSDRTVVAFLVTRAAYRSVNAEVLQRRAVMEEIRRDCTAIQEQIGARLFTAVAHRHWPQFEELVDEYWRLRLRRALHSWRTSQAPPVVTHDLAFPGDDAVLRQLRQCGLTNAAADRVKFVYYPEFVSSSDPLFGMDYDQFVRGCHLGLFPSLYEPWGYAPLECVMLGIPSITSDLAGFGAFVQDHVPGHDELGIRVLPRWGVPFDAAAKDLAERTLAFTRMERRERIALRNRVESVAEQFDWEALYPNYTRAHEMAVRELGEHGAWAPA